MSVVKATAMQNGGRVDQRSDVDVFFLLVSLPTGPGGPLLSSILGLHPCTGSGGGGISCLLQNTGKDASVNFFV